MNLPVGGVDISGGTIDTEDTDFDLQGMPTLYIAYVGLRVLHCIL